MRNPVFLALLVALLGLPLVGCNGAGPECTSENLPGISFLALVPLGEPVDVELLERDADEYAGALQIDVVEGELPAGLSIDGTRLVGTPTAEGTTTTSLTIRPVDASLCTSDDSLTIEVRARECISDQACHARAGGPDDPCVSSSDCEPFGGLAGHCVQVLEESGVCLLQDIGCSGSITTHAYVDTEGRPFDSCGSDVAVTCSADGFCS